MAQKDDEPDDVRRARLAPHLAPVDGIPIRFLPLDDAWRAAARQRLDELKKVKVDQHDLGFWVGCSQGSISQVLGEKPPLQRSFKYLERVAAALDVPLPLLTQWWAVGDDLLAADPEIVRTLLSLARQVLRKKP